MTVTTGASLLELPRRQGPPPRTGPVVPHEQLDQNGSAELGAVLWRQMSSLEGVRTGRSGISAPSTRALHLRRELALGSPDAFLVGTEFAHLHGAHDGSLHATLPVAAVGIAMERGWGELHPIARMGIRPPTLVMLYSPRDASELAVIWQFVHASYRFARGPASS